MKSAISNTTLSARGCPWNKKNQIYFSVWVPSKIVSQFGPAVWPAIYVSEELYFIDFYNYH